jgi:hypothetical protein
MNASTGSCHLMHGSPIRRMRSPCCARRVKQRSGPAPLADAQPSLQGILEDDRSRLFEGLEGFG